MVDVVACEGGNGAAIDGEVLVAPLVFKSVGEAEVLPLAVVEVVW